MGSREAKANFLPKGKGKDKKGKFVPVPPSVPDREVMARVLQEDAQAAQQEVAQVAQAQRMPVQAELLVAPEAGQAGNSMGALLIIQSSICRCVIVVATVMRTVRTMRVKTSWGATW